ncbi:unnamed protein product [Haemonchus placei]|uniref:VWFA domain-containing protein n=1 Tax=Haemonchus placei TaxID=6290 RepID=A0A0N4W802_HAEPC|nr:unnamed protein product [Haemonchus placei]
MMTFDRCTRLLINIVVIGIVLVNSVEDDNELVKVCHPIALRLNVLFLLDGSGSVSGPTFAMQMQMLDKIASLMNIGRDKSQIAVLQYASYTRLEHSFEDRQSHDELMSKLKKIRHMSGTTKTGKAMLKALDMFRKARRGHEQSDVSQVAVVVTDGHSQDNPVPAAEALRAAGITILTLGIGDHINRDEIVRISGKDELAFQNLHKNVSLEHFVAGFKNLSQGEHCEYARGIEGAEITCGPDFVQVGISTTKKLKGRLFFEGYHQEPGCSSVEDYLIGSEDKSRFDVHTIAPHGKCGLVKVYEAESRGFVISSRAVLQFDRRFATDNDHTFEIRCFYPDKKKTVKSPERAQGVSTLLTGADLNWRVIIWCITQKSIINSLDYSKNGIVTAVGKAVRFADVPVVKFSCRLRFCNLSDEQCSSGMAPQCRTKRETLDNDASLSKDEQKEYDVYEDDNVEERNLEPEMATVALMDEPTTTVSMPLIFGDPLRTAKIPLRSASLMEPSDFPSGGIDIKLNTKQVAIVSSDHARDRFKQALQLRANAQPVAGSLDSLDTSLPNGVPRRAAPAKSTFNGLAVKHVKGFVRQLPKPLSIQEMHQLLPTSSSTQEPQETSTTEALEEDDTSVIDEDAVLEDSVTTTTLATTDAPTPTSTVSYTSATSTFPPAKETVVDDDEIEEEVVVVSDMIVLRLPHETFITGCNKHASC